MVRSEIREMNKYTITSALPYANGPLHIGHLSGAYLSADIFARVHRLLGDEVLFVGGSDEHGAAITTRAIKEGVSPQEIVDKYHEMFIDTFAKYGISFDHYFRTSDPLHHEYSQKIFENVYANGGFKALETEQYFDPTIGQFLADRYIKGECPKCHYTEAYGDQCEKCGSTLSPENLINPISTLSDATPEIRKTTHWFFPLDSFQEQIQTWLNKSVSESKSIGTNLWKTHVIGQCNSWLDGGLVARSMTRDLNWGIDVPKSIPHSQGKKLYVWFDAPFGYISSTIDWAKRNNKNWEEYWKGDNSRVIHFIGKDNIVFHCITFPALLMALGGYNLPYNVPANQFMNLEGNKISTSKNWAIWAKDFADAHPDKIDEMRYVLIKNMPEQKDSEFTWKTFQDDINSDLVNNISNFIHRTIVLSDKFFSGKISNIDFDCSFDTDEEDDLGGIGFHDSELVYLHDRIQEYRELIDNYNFRGALKVITDISSRGNLLMQKNEPWKTIKEDEEIVKVLLHTLLHYNYVLAILLQPIIPHKSLDIFNLLNKETPKSGDLNKTLDLLSEGELLIEDGHQIGKPRHIFQKIDNEFIAKQVELLHNSSKIKNTSDLSLSSNENCTQIQTKSEIDFDHFSKLDIRVGLVLDSKKVDKAEKLLVSQIDIGNEIRTIVSGVALCYDPTQLIGKKVPILANLTPKKIRGILSHGMVLCADLEDGSLSMLGFDRNVTPGSSIK